MGKTGHIRISTALKKGKRRAITEAENGFKNQNVRKGGENMLKRIFDLADEKLELVYSRKKEGDGYTYEKFIRGRDVGIGLLVVVLVFAAALFFGWFRG